MSGYFDVKLGENTEREGGAREREIEPVRVFL